MKILEYIKLYFSLFFIFVGWWTILPGYIIYKNGIGNVYIYFTILIIVIIGTGLSFEYISNCVDNEKQFNSCTLESN